MLRFTFNGATVEIEDREATLRLLEFEIKAQKEAHEREQALMVVYRIGGEGNPKLPYDGLLTERLQISTDTAYEMIRSGQIGYTCCGKKNYRVSEYDVRVHLGLLKQAS